MGNIIILTWKKLIRNKANTFWILCFPIILGTFFNIAFSNMGNSENMKAIPIAVICEDNQYGDTLKESINSVSKGDNPLFVPTFIEDKEEGLKLLEKREIYGIIESGDTVTLTLSSDMSSESTMQSIVSSFVDEYNMYQTAFVDIMENHPENLESMLNALDSTTEYNQMVSISRKPDANPYTSYFYNLIAMNCLFTALGGVLVATENQANLSALGARKCISPTHKLVTITGEIIATSVYEFVLNAIGFSYVAFVLKVDILSRLPLAILAMVVGCLTGVSLGFFIGSLGTKQADFKQGMVFAVTMPLCFLSGLMMGDMPIIIQNNCPILNKINPATLISDSFYSLAIYENFGRFSRDIIILVAFIIIFGFTGFLITRRQKYANL